MRLISILAAFLYIVTTGQTLADERRIVKPALALGLEYATPAFERPVYVISHPTNAARLYVVEQGGYIHIVENGKKLPGPLVDISEQVVSGGEKGLYSLAFDPRFLKNRRFYIFYFARDYHTVVSRLRLSRTDPDHIIPGEEKIILRISQPHSNHNGGQLQFGPDNYLYIGTGDGGSQGDPNNYAQSLDTPLGKILRLSVRRLPATAPETNPFVKRPDALHSIWAYGLRNPWRFSFDRMTGDLWIADVGQNDIEEVNFVPATSKGGINFGWAVMEGDQCYNPSSGCDRSGKQMPVHVYPHTEGASITGGYVYRGAAIPALNGHYFFADIVSRRVWSFRLVKGVTTDFTEWTGMLKQPDGSGVTPSSFGQDANGELYICDYYSGHVLKIVAK